MVQCSISAAAECLQRSLFSSAVLGSSIPFAFAQNNDAKPAERPRRPVRSLPKSRRRSMSSPRPSARSAGRPAIRNASGPGRRVVGLLWRDDLDTAFRHLDLYDRFGCPGAHIQASFRCLILHGVNIDPKAADTLNARVQAAGSTRRCRLPLPPPRPRARPPRTRPRRRPNSRAADPAGGQKNQRNKVRCLEFATVTATVILPLLGRLISTFTEPSGQGSVVVFLAPRG